jgi:hypothetical protein
MIEFGESYLSHDYYLFFPPYYVIVFTSFLLAGYGQSTLPSKRSLLDGLGQKQTSLGFLGKSKGLEDLSIDQEFSSSGEKHKYAELYY